MSDEAFAIPPKGVTPPMLTDHSIPQASLPVSGPPVFKYFVAVNERRKGPFTLEELRRSNVQRDMLVWHSGMAKWVPAGELPELADFLPDLPPPIPDQIERVENREAWSHVRRVGVWRRALNWCTLAWILIVGIEAIGFATLSDPVKLVLGFIIFGLCGFCIVSAMGTAAALNLRLTPFWGLAAEVPVIAWIVLAILYHKTNVRLRQAGLQVGLLGPQVPQVPPPGVEQFYLADVAPQLRVSVWRVLAYVATVLIGLATLMALCLAIQS
jgi:hypothetical protein